MYRPWLNNIDRSKRILEIGPLASPNIKKEPGVNIFYSDIRTTEDIKNIYKNDKSVRNENISDIDFVIDGGGNYKECLKNVEKFDYVIATHVIEHVPQLIFFFQDISCIMKEKGKLCLVIPDKRFCFDHFRSTTSFAECYDIYFKNINNIPYRIMDHILNYTNNDPVYWWKENNNFESLKDIDIKKYKNAKNFYNKATEGEYIDAHFSVFTPKSFLLLLFHMVAANMLPFRCVEFYKTELNTFEFNCVLEYEPNILIEDSEDNLKERVNLIYLLNLNQDQEYNELDIKILKNEINDYKIINEKLKEKIISNEILISKYEKEIEVMLCSKSWEITKPLREIKKVINKIIQRGKHD